MAGSLDTRPRWAGGAQFAPAVPYFERAVHERDFFERHVLSAYAALRPEVLSFIELRKLSRLADRVESLKSEIAHLSERKLREAAASVRIAFVRGDNWSEAIARAFALTQEACQRALGLRHYPVQLMGGGALLGGAVAEMATGEGKTITAAIAAATAALAGSPVHVITVNDYLVRRDAEQLRPVYDALGLRVGVIEAGLSVEEKRAAYACDITYCTNKEIVFDYLRDRLAIGRRRSRSQLLLEEHIFGKPLRSLLLRGLHVAIVDEADSVLIDEARTPLILAGREHVGQTVDLYARSLEIALGLIAGEHFQVLSGEKRIVLKPEAQRVIAELTSGLEGVWAARRAREELIVQALSAVHFYHRDAQYIVADGKVRIVDDFTGRVMPDRSWERGLHQMIEAKEGCEITGQRRTLARITYQRFFRRYGHLCGMTGTAAEAAGELRSVYGLPVVRLPTNRPLHRHDQGTRVYRTSDQKWSAVMEATCNQVQQGRAVLIGTRSVAASEHLGELLAKTGISPAILNARQDSEEASIVARAGQRGRVTVATNMAGRGTDIRLEASVRERGGLHVILTEFHESPRIDRQLYGRAGRQGDPGSFEAIVSLEDELLNRFARRATGWLSGTLSDTGAECVFRPIGSTLRRFAQISAERQNARTRRETLTEDTRLEKALAFTGVGE